MNSGQKGSILFAVLNVLQLVGWNAIMIYDGALAADGVMHTGRWIWCLVIGALIILWIVIGITNLGKINTVAMAALFLLTLILSRVIFAGGGAGAPSDGGRTCSCDAVILAAVDQRLHKRSKRAGQSNGCQRDGLWNRQLLDARHRNGSSDHHRRI